MKTFYYALCAIIVCCTIVSCSSIGNKSVLEPLSSEEQQELVRNEGCLAMTITICDLIKVDQLPRSKQEDLKDLTYKRLNDFLVKMANPDEALKQRLEKEWDEIYGPKLKEIESVSNKYKQEFEDAKPDKLVKVEWIGIDDATDAYMGGANITIRLSPLQGEVQAFEAYYGITLKGSEPYFSYFESTGRNHINIENSFSKPIEIQTYISFNTSDVEPTDFKSLSPQQLQEKYNFQISLERVKKENQYHTRFTAHNKVPSYIQTLWEHENDKDWGEYKEMWLASAAKDLFNMDIEEKSVYVNKRIKEHEYEEDPIAAWLVYEYFFKSNQF